MWELDALYRLLRYLMGGDSETKATLLAGALRRARSPLIRRRAEALFRHWVSGPRADVWRNAKPGRSRYTTALADDEMVQSLVLKARGPDGEKGVLYVSFEFNWLRLLEHYDVSRLLTEYFLVGAPSWSPPDYPSLLAFANVARDPVFMQISNLSDVEALRVCEPVIRAVPIMACDWIHPKYYAPKPHGTREIDILMVAGWARFKGHWRLFGALRRMRADLRVVLIGQDMEGRTADDVFAEAKAFGVDRRIEIVRDAPVSLVTSYQCNSRIAVVLSRQEGSGVVTAESFFANTPVAMLRGAHVGSSAYINAETGILAHPSHLHRSLSALVERSESYAPRAWALQHITCFRSTLRLNSFLRQYALGSGQPWSRDIVPLCWRPDPLYVDDADRLALAPAYQELFDRHGLRFALPRIDERATA